ncbi:DUF7064 domain-containing protein [Mesorhizobium australicum]|uniref:Hydroxyneurosporene synthase (CrtC) n=1 Tax=Mesorhizobium australicum TaxID=536018 RepID=A0A1X7PRQ8_9HYPH|nr:hypothetical protein [Mesorhizobium australicum]SMH54758.1 hypothetical protein SAMN02982922_5173 [Mesorhizobium australicum]
MIDWIKNAPEITDPGYQPKDDLRHRAADGGRARDSLFWQVIMPDHELGFQCYLYLTGTGKAGFNLILWGTERKPYVLELVQGDVPDTMDFDDFRLGDLRVRQPADQKTARIAFESDKVKLDYSFEGFHAPFSYRSNPDGLPSWFADNRLEQSGWVKGYIEWDGKRIELDRIGHRDHSWGVRHWQVPQHWKWLVAYAPDASRIVNAWIWMAKGEWGVGGYVVRDGELVPIASVDQKAAFDDDMTQRSIDVQITDIRGGTCSMQMERFGLVKLPTGGRHATMIMEAACRAKIDGRDAAGQFECQWPQSYLDAMIELNKTSR